MNSNTKRKDVDDIYAIIKQLDDNGEYVCAPTIAKQLGQSPANVHRIMQNFKIDLKPYQRKFRANRAILQAKETGEALAQLRGIDTANYTVAELAKRIAYPGTEKQLKTVMINHALPYKTKSWFAQYLKKVDTHDKTLNELYEQCNLDGSDISFATFRTRLYENAIPYKQLIQRKNWWQNLSGVNKHVPQDAVDELYRYFEDNQVNPADYTLKELYGYFDFNMPYLAFKHIVISQGIQTHEVRTCETD